MTLTHPAFDNFPLSYEEVLAAFPGQVAGRVMPLRCRDGDTYEAIGELPRHEIDFKAYRILGIDAPELHADSSEQRQAAQKALAFLTALIVSRPMVSITFRDRMNFDRYLAVPILVSESGKILTDIRPLLVQNECAVWWTRDTWISRLGRFPDPGDKISLGGLSLRNPE